MLQKDKDTPEQTEKDERKNTERQTEGEILEGRRDGDRSRKALI